MRQHKRKTHNKVRATKNNKNTTENKNNNKNKTQDAQGRRQKSREAKDDVDENVENEYRPSAYVYQCRQHAAGDNTSDHNRSISADNGYINNTNIHNMHKHISRHISEHLGDMVGLCLPPALRHMVDDLIGLAVKSMPSETLLSQYRVLLDGAFMLASRVLNERLRLDGGATRYIMADSSMQHGHQFEVVQVQTIPNRDIGLAFRLAGDLHRLRRFCFLSAKHVVCFSFATCRLIWIN